MSVTSTAASGNGPGLGTSVLRTVWAEWPLGGALKNPGVVGPKHGPLSVSMWVRCDRSTNAEACFLSLCTTDGPERLYLGTDESGDTPELFVGSRTLTTGTFPSLGFGWHWFGYRTDGNGYHELYEDGALILRLQLEPENRRPFDRLMLWSATATAQFVGAIAGVKLFEDYRSVAALIAEANAGGAVVDPTNLFVWYPLANVGDLADHSGNGRHLVASNTILVPSGPPPYGSVRLKPPNLPPSSQAPLPAYI